MQAGRARRARRCPGRARNAGLARGPRRLRLVPRLARRAAARAASRRASAPTSAGYAMVTGTILNGTPTRAGLGLLLPRPLRRRCPDGRRSELRGPPAHCSYVRELAARGRRLPRGHAGGRGHGRQQRARGARPPRLPGAGGRLVHPSPCTGPLRLVRHHFRRGRGLGRILRRRHRDRPRLLSRRACAAICSATSRGAWRATRRARASAGEASWWHEYGGRGRWCCSAFSPPGPGSGSSC